MTAAPRLYDESLFPPVFDLAQVLAGVPGGKPRWDLLRAAMPDCRWEVHRAVADLAATIKRLAKSGRSLTVPEAMRVFEVSLRRAADQTLAAKQWVQKTPANPLTNL